VGIRHITTSPYYPQASQVEPFNRNLKAALVIYYNSQHTHWDEHLSSLAIAFNSAWHQSTAATPASLFLGRELNHPLGLKWHLYELELQKDSMNFLFRSCRQNYFSKILQPMRARPPPVASSHVSWFCFAGATGISVGSFCEWYSRIYIYLYLCIGCN
jgi:hypothetical protein